MKEHKKYRDIIMRFIVKLFVLCMIVLLVLSYGIGIRQVRGISMDPHIKDGDFIIFNRLNNEYHIRDIVVYEYNGELRYGRIVAMSNDIVDFSEGGILKLNGNIQSEEMLYPTYPISSSIIYPYTVSQDGCFILSDYRIQGEDSREYGEIELSHIKGKVITILRMRSI